MVQLRYCIAIIFLCYYPSLGCMEQSLPERTESLSLLMPPEKIPYIAKALKDSYYQTVTTAIAHIDRQQHSRLILIEDKEKLDKNNFVMHLNLFIVRSLKRSYIKLTKEMCATQESQSNLYTSLNRKKLSQPIILVEDLTELSASNNVKNLSDVLSKLSDSYLVLATATDIATLPFAIKKLLTTPCEHPKEGLIKRIFLYDERAAVFFKTTALCKRLFSNYHLEYRAEILKHSLHPNLETLEATINWISHNKIELLKSSDRFSDNPDQIALKIWSLMTIKKPELLPELLAQINITKSSKEYVEKAIGFSEWKIYHNVLDYEQIAGLINHYNDIEKILF